MFRFWAALRVREKLFALVLTPLLVLGLFTGCVLWSLRLGVAAAHETTNSVAALRLTYRLQKTLLDSETGMRGYVATDKPSFLQPYDESEPKLPLRVGLFRSEENDASARKLGVVVEARAYTAMALINRYVDLTRNGRRNVALAEIRGGAGKRAMDAFRAAIALYQEHQIKRFAADTKRARLVEERSFELVVGGFFIAALLILVPFFIVSGSLVSRLRRLRQTAVALRRNVPVAASHTVDDDEITEVERALRAMSEALAERHTALTELGVLQHAILDEIGYGISTMTKDGTLTSFNRGAERLLGYRAADVVGQMTFERFCLPEDPAGVAAAVSSAEAAPKSAQIAALLSTLAAPGAREREWTYVRADGTRVPVMTTLTPLCRDGETFGYLSIAHDRTERNAADLALRREQEQAVVVHQLRSLNSIATTGDEAPVHPVEAALSLVLAQLDLQWAYLATVDASQGHVTFVRSIGRECELDEPRRAGARLALAATHLGPVLRSEQPLAIDDLATPGEYGTGPYPYERTGSYLAVPVRVFGRVYGAIAFVGGTARAEPFTEANIDFVRLTSELVGAAIERDLQRERLDALALTDALTELPNRVLLHDRLLQIFLSAERHDEQFGIFYIDLDDFRRVNDTFGHAAGDSVLQVVAKRLSSLLRDSDTLARLGGNEFVVVASKLADLSDGTIIAERILTALNRPFTIAGTTYALGASIGISLFPPHGRNAEMLFKQADSALCVAKRRGKNCFVFADKVAPEPYKREGLHYIRLVS